MTCVIGDPKRSIVHHLLRTTCFAILALSMLACGAGNPAVSDPASAGQVSLASSAINFGSIPVGQSVSVTNTLSNTGSGPLNFDSITASGDFAVASTQCGSTLSPGQACVLSVQFTPAAAGERTGTLSINGQNSRASASLSGTGLTPGKIAISNPTAAFPGTSVGTSSSSLTFALSNVGEMPVIVQSISVSGDFAVNSGQCPLRLSGSGQCPISVAFVPSQAGIRTGLLTVVSDAGSATASLLATATPAKAVQPSLDATVRFLRQVGYGATPSLVSEVQTVGFSAWIDQEINTPAYDYTSAAATGPGQYYRNTQNSSLVLRQRVSSALSQIFVTSDDNVCEATFCGPLWESLIERDAFANIETLIHDVALSPIMGAFLNNGNNVAGVYGGVPNQNFAREVMQLMTIGTQQLASDGTPILDTNGNIIPTYDQDNVAAMALALDGWSYAGPNHGFGCLDPSLILQPMIMDENGHDQGAKNILPGVTIPAGQGGVSDFSSVLSALVGHPNIGPFLGKQLIQHLVKSNPSPAYVGRIAAVFADDGSGTRGNLGAIVKAIVLDPEARLGDDPTAVDPSAGHFMEPILYIASVMNAIGGVFTDDQVRGSDSALGEQLYVLPDVFSYYSPDHLLADGTPAPEAQLADNAHAFAKLAFAYNMMNNSAAGLSIDWTSSPFWNMPSEAALLDLINHLLYAGRMSPAIRTALAGYIDSQPNATLNSLLPTVIFFAVSNTSYQVIR